MAPCSDNMMFRNGFMHHFRMMRSHDDSWHRGNFKKSELMKQKSAVQELVTVTQAKRTIQNRHIWFQFMLGDFSDFYPAVGPQDMARACVLLGSVFAWAEGLLVLWALPVLMFVSICLFPGQMYGSTALERCMPASEEWDLHEQYPLIRWQDVLRVSITIGSMIAYAEGLLPLWTVPVVMLLGVCMFPGQMYGHLAFFPVQDECLKSSGDVFEQYPTMGWQDMTRSCIFIASILGCAEGHLPLWSLPVLMLVTTCVFPGQIYSYIAPTQEDESKECIQASMERDVFEEYPPMGLPDMIRALIFIGLIFCCAEGYLPLWSLPVLMFASICVFPGQAYRNMWNFVNPSLFVEANMFLQLFFALPLLASLDIDQDDIRGVGPESKKILDDKKILDADAQ